MFDVYRICRLCMAEIEKSGVDCMHKDQLRSAIKTLYGVEVNIQFDEIRWHPNGNGNHFRFR